MSVLRDEGEYLPSITRCQECQKYVPDNSSQREREQEFPHWILHGTRGKQKWNHGHWWRQQGGDSNRAQAPTLEDLVYLLQLPGREPARECFLSSFASKPVRDEASYHRTDGCHQGVVKPQLFVTCRQEDRKYVHAPRERDEGAVEEPEGNKAQTTELVDPEPDASCHSGCCSRNNLKIAHFLS